MTLPFIPSSDHAGPVLYGSVIHCHLCGFAHVYPLPDDVESYYEEDQFYTTHSPSDWFEKERREFEERLWTAAFDYQISLLSENGALGQSLIDWGAGTGLFLVHWLSRGGFGFGIEPSASARDASSVSSILYPMIEDRENRWNYRHARSSLVLEHVRNPMEEVKKMASFMRDDGRLMVIVPNDFSPLQSLLNTHHFVSKVHLNYFTPATLRSLLHRAGLKVIYETATFPTEAWILMGLDHRGNDRLGRRLHNWRLRFERRFGSLAFWWYKKLYDRLGWGRELIFVAEREN